MILTTADFKGPLSLPESKYVDVDYYIDRYTNEYLKRILGVDLYNQVVIDPDNILIERIYYPFELCEGLKETLMHFIFCEYNQALQSQNTMVGNVVSKNENSESTGGYLMMKQMWNEAVKQTKLIQCYLKEHSTDADANVCQVIFENINFAQFKPYDTVITVGDIIIPARKYYSPYQVAAIISNANNDIKFQQSLNAIRLYSETDLSGVEIKFNYNDGADKEIVLTFGSFDLVPNIYSKYSYSKFDYIIF